MLLRQCTVLAVLYLLPSGVSNVGAPILLEATRTAEQNTYAGIVRMDDRYALFFIPLTMLIAGVAWLVSGDPLRALATPCPLILAVPRTFMSGISRAARDSD